MAVARSEARVEIVAHSEARVEVVACSETEDEAGRASGPGSRTVGGDGMIVSRVTQERER
jgi:hypothetical protein